MLLINLVKSINRLDKKISSINENEIESHQLRMSTIEILKRYVFYSTEYIKATVIRDTDRMEVCINKLNEIADELTPDRVAEIPMKAKQDLRTNNKILKEITQKFLKN